MFDFVEKLDIFNNAIFAKSAEIVLIAVINFLLYKILMQVIKRLIKKSKNIRNDTLITVIASTIRYIFYFSVICQIFSVFNISVMSILAVAGVSSIAIGFGAQNLVKDIIAGVFILFEDQFNIGDVITISDKTGTVETIGLRITRLRSFDGNVHIIPNGEIKIITNMTKEYNMAIVDFDISYSDNTDRAVEIIKDELALTAKHMTYMLEIPTVLGITAIEEGLVRIRIIAKCETGKKWEVEREIRRLVKNRLNNEGFNPPYKRMIITENLQLDDKD